MQKAEKEQYGVVRLTIAQRVMDLCGLNTVIEVQVVNYHQLPEDVKQMIHSIYYDEIVCKIPVHGTDNLIIYMSTRISEMGELMNRLLSDDFPEIEARMCMIVEPNKQNRMPNVNRSLYSGKEARV